MTNDTTTNDIAEFRLFAWNDTDLEVGIPGTDYRILLDHAGGPQPAEIGRRTKGRVTGKALKVSKPSAGGNYIEPIEGGHPRIVQGTVIATSPATGQLLVDLVVPFWIELTADQSASEFTTGDVVTFHMKSGTRFDPV